MKVTIFGLTISSSWGNGHATPYRALLRALQRRGHQVSFYEKDVPYYASRRDFAECSYCQLVLYSSWDEIRHQALEEAAQSDVVVVASYCPEGARISEAVFELARPAHVFYDLDTPVTLQNLERGDLDYLRRKQVPAFDLYLSFTGGSILQQLEHRWGARATRPLYGCVDPDVYYRVPQRLDYNCALSYMGTYSADRQHKFEDLFLIPACGRPDLSFLLAGSLYPQQKRIPKNVRMFEHVAPADHPALYCSSRLTLNITRDGMARFGYCPSGRFFEAAACATPIVSDWWEGLESFFVPEEELFLAQSSDDVLAALQSSPDELARVGARARQRTLEEHTGDVRAEQFLSYCEQALQSSVAVENGRES